jgi:hypothetical protein
MKCASTNSSFFSLLPLPSTLPVLSPNTLCSCHLNSSLTTNVLYSILQHARQSSDIFSFLELFCPSRLRAIPNIRYNKGRLPSSTQDGIYNSTEASFPSLLPQPSHLTPFDSRIHPTPWSAVHAIKCINLDLLLHRRRHIGLESLGLWTKGPRDHD